jgi:hypothetical protein
MGGVWCVGTYDMDMKQRLENLNIEWRLKSYLDKIEDSKMKYYT